jgi:hypothetical protein
MMNQGKVNVEIKKVFRYEIKKYHDNKYHLVSSRGSEKRDGK